MLSNLILEQKKNIAKREKLQPDPFTPHKEWPPLRCFSGLRA
jgi:hypothetical protein